jgi:hypothetical protein
MTTYTSTLLLWSSTRLSPALRAALPAASRRMLHAALGTVHLQAALGISTLLYLVPVPLAAAHQAGSVLLLTCMVHLLATLRAPGSAAKAWRAARVGGAGAVGGGSPAAMAAAAVPSQVLRKEAATKVRKAAPAPVVPRVTLAQKAPAAAAKKSASPKRASPAKGAAAKKHVA